MGFRGRFKNKRDANEGEVIATLRAYGLSVVTLDTPVDLLCGYGGKTWAVEVKVGKAPLTEAQIAFFETWRGNHTVIRCVADAEEFAKEIRGYHEKTL